MNSEDCPERSTEVTGWWSSLSMIRVKLPVDSLLREQNWHRIVVRSFVSIWQSWLVSLRHCVNDEHMFIRVCMHLYVSLRVYEDTIEILSIVFHPRRWRWFDIDVRDRRPVRIVGSRTCVPHFLLSRYTPITLKECTLYNTITQSWHDEGNK